MKALLDPFSFVVTVIAGLMRRHQQEARATGRLQEAERLLERALASAEARLDAAAPEIGRLLE